MSVGELTARNFFPSSPHSPQVGFHIKLMEFAALIYEVGDVPHLRLWEIVVASFASQTPVPRDLYERFMAALRQFMFIRHLITHGKQSVSDIRDGAGSTVCPACSPAEDFSGSLFKVQNVHWAHFSYCSFVTGTSRHAGTTKVKRV
jgi:hypothetical protein